MLILNSRSLFPSTSNMSIGCIILILKYYLDNSRKQEKMIYFSLINISNGYNWSKIGVGYSMTKSYNITNSCKGKDIFDFKINHKEGAKCVLLLILKSSIM